MPACAVALLVEAEATMAVRAAVIMVLRFIMACLSGDSVAHRIAQRAHHRRSTSRYGWIVRSAQRNDEVRAFAGFALVDALVGNHDRAAGRQGFRDARHRIRRNRDAV